MRGSRPASRAELAGLMPAVAEAHLFSDLDAFTVWRDEAPWRVRVTEEGSAVVLARWREHLPLLAVLGIWCPQRQLTALLRDVVRVAREEGFRGVVGPLVPEEAVRPYADAGFETAGRIVVCRLGIRELREAGPVDGLSIAEGGSADLADVLALDARCFDEFWRYDAATLGALAAGSRLVLARRGGALAGYALGAAHGVEATLARLAVAPGDRRRGIGSTLVRETVSRLADAGAKAVTLTTQEDNEESRRLYRREGFRESPGRLVYTVSPSVRVADGAAGKG